MRCFHVFRAAPTRLLYAPTRTRDERGRRDRHERQLSNSVLSHSVYSYESQSIRVSVLSCVECSEYGGLRRAYPLFIPDQLTTVCCSFACGLRDLGAEARAGGMGHMLIAVQWYRM
eukprot:3359211-Prymnesium_polylepis.2